MSLHPNIHNIYTHIYIYTYVCISMYLYHDLKKQQMLYILLKCYYALTNILVCLSGSTFKVIK